MSCAKITQPNKANGWFVCVTLLKQLKQSRATGTTTNYYKLINTMKEWKPALSFGEITMDFIQQFHNHELEVGNILSTVYKKHSNLKFLIDIAVDKEKLKRLYLFRSFF